MSAGDDDRRSGRRSVRVWVVAGTALALQGPFIAAMAALAIDRTPTEAAGAANLHALIPFWLTAALGWAALTLLWWALQYTDVSRPCARVPAGFILITSAAIRLIVAATHTPALSDDHYRYQFDGRTVAAGWSPYLETPAARREAATERWPGERDLAALVNHPQMHSIDLPASQGLFGAVAVAERFLPEMWRGPWALRLTMILLDLFVIALLLSLLRAAGRSAWWAALYAWHPLTIAEIAGSGHQDLLGLALMLSALALASRRPRAVAGPASLLAVAAMVKPVALAAAVLLLKGRPRRDWFIAATVMVLVGGLSAAPLLLTGGGEPMVNFAAAAKRFALKWAHFGAVYEPLLAALESLAPHWTNDA
jgi:hypothetical protein